MLNLATLLLCVSTPQDRVLRDSVDLAEVNHFFDGDEARHVFDQVIWYDWSEAESRYNIRAWMLIREPVHLPKRAGDGSYSSLWMDNGHIRKVESKEYRETWTQYDAVWLEWGNLSKSKRRALTQPINNQR